MHPALPDIFLVLASMISVGDLLRLSIPKSLETFQLPLKLNKNGTEQMLFKISPNLYNGKYSPCVEYVTTTPLNNNEELEKEAKQMIPQLEENYTGIAKDVDFILFIAYEEYPEDENKDYKVFKSAIKVNDKNKKRGQDSN